MDATTGGQYVRYSSKLIEAPVLGILAGLGSPRPSEGSPRLSLLSRHFSRSRPRPTHSLMHSWSLSLLEEMDTEADGRAVNFRPVNLCECVMVMGG